MTSDEHIKTKDITYDLIVIGGGPAGMMCAGRASHLGAHVLLLEKNKQLGKKLGITGGGRCNITNAEYDVHKLLDNFKDAKPYLFSPFSQFGVKETFSFFEKLGLPLVVEARKRAFPKTQNAKDVVKAMEKYLKRTRVKTRTGIVVTGISKIDDLFHVSTEDTVFTARAVSIGTGNLATPETGSTGDGFRFAQALGHTIAKPNPHIVPLTTDAKWVHMLSGVSLSFMTLRFKQDVPNSSTHSIGVNPTGKDARASKTHIKKTGKILFTHFGISGPLVLNTSSEVSYLLENGPVTAEVDAFPDTEIGDLDRRIWRLFEAHKNKLLKNVLPEMLPKKLTEVLLTLPHAPDPETEVNSVTKEERSWLAHTLKALSFPITGTLGLERAVIADGGVVLDEVETKTMESRIVENLFMLGDTLNINRPSGGYSLQLAWTTGWVAGSAIAKDIKLSNTPTESKESQKDQ
jgi:hypothetical protein